MIVKINVLRPQLIGTDKVLVTRRPLVLCVSRQHALDRHADALDVLYGTPALVSEQVQANDAVAVDVRVHGYRAVGRLVEGDFRRLYGRPAAVSRLPSAMHFPESWDTPIGYPLPNLNFNRNVWPA